MLNIHPSESLIKNITLISSISIFILSLSQECFCTDNSCGGAWSGLAILISGGFGFSLSPAGFTWLANILLLVSWIIFKKTPQKTFYFAIIAFIISLSFLFFDKIVSDEAGNYHQITGYRLGYWLWCSSSLIIVIGIWVIFVYFKPSAFKTNTLYGE
jgi:hypothetical protein